MYHRIVGWFGWLCLTSHRQGGHLEAAPPFTVPCGGREARFLHRPYWESNPGSLRGSQLRNRCATPAPIELYFDNLNTSIVKRMISIYLVFWFDIIVYFGISTVGFCDSDR